MMYDEHDLAQRWYALPSKTILPLIGGERCLLRYSGRAGGPQGPDVRDAVFSFREGRELVGDVEFHVRCSDWYRHCHHADARYNSVVLHVVLVYDREGPVLRQDGSAVPVCSLNDLVPTALPEKLWPCRPVMASLAEAARSSLLREAGLLRFAQKQQAFALQLDTARPTRLFNASDSCLIPALAEALGYGRDRALFRALGERLVGLPSALPEPRGRAVEPPRLDSGRLGALAKLVARWSAAGAGETLRNNLSMSALRAIFAEISPARADIVVCNVILPFAAAIGAREGDAALVDQAARLYETYPALASNTITRSMCAQLGLEREPRRACEQQGLQYLYAQTCREKRCAECLLVRREL